MNEESTWTTCPVCTKHGKVGPALLTPDGECSDGCGFVFKKHQFLSKSELKLLRIPDEWSEVPLGGYTVITSEYVGTEAPTKRATWDNWVKMHCLTHPPACDIVLPLPEKTDNYRTKFNKWVPSYRRTVFSIIMITKTEVPDPPFVLLYRVNQVKSKGRYADPHNYSKTLIDAIMGKVDDCHVHPWNLPGTFDAKQAGIEVWMVKLS